LLFSTENSRNSFPGGNDLAVPTYLSKAAGRSTCTFGKRKGCFLGTIKKLAMQIPHLGLVEFHAQGGCTLLWVVGNRQIGEFVFFSQEMCGEELGHQFVDFGIPKCPMPAPFNGNQGHWDTCFPEAISKPD